MLNLEIPGPRFAPQDREPLPPALAPTSRLILGPSSHAPGKPTSIVVCGHRFRQAKLTKKSRAGLDFAPRTPVSRHCPHFTDESSRANDCRMNWRAAKFRQKSP
jgi:hypothetical protein